MTTKRALIDIMSSRGASLKLDEGRVSVFRLDDRGTLGAHHDGMYFWHDYIGEKRSIEEMGSAIVTELNETYRRRWSRIEAILNDPLPIKHLIVSDAQQGLIGMAGGPGQPSLYGSTDDFQTMFEIDETFVSDLANLIIERGCRRCTLHFLVRSIDTFSRLARSHHAPNVDIRFVGELGLPLNPSIGTNLIADVLSGSAMPSATQDLDGRYEGGITIETYKQGAALISMHAKVVGEVRASAGCLAVFTAGTTDGMMLARQHGCHLHFSTGERWTKLGGTC